jgi:FMN reductase
VAGKHVSSPALVAVLGSVTPPGRLRRGVGDALDRVSEASTELIDLAEHEIAFAGGQEPDGETTRVLDAIAAADGVVLATPVYRGTFTGVLKNLLDHIPVDGLRGKPVGIVAMGATQHHSLGADWHLRDVLAWFGAVAAPTSVYLASSDFESGVPRPEAAQALDELLATVVTLAGALRSAELGPPPLAARSR